MINQEIRSNKDGLRDFQQQALLEHFPTAKALADRMLGLMGKGADLYDKFAGTPEYEQGPTLREVVYAYEKLAENVIYPKEEEFHEVRRTTVNIDLKDPEAMKSLFAAMRGEPAQKVIELKKEE